MWPLEAGGKKGSPKEGESPTEERKAAPKRRKAQQRKGSPKEAFVTNELQVMVVLAPVPLKRPWEMFQRREAQPNG